MSRFHLIYTPLLLATACSGGEPTTEDTPAPGPDDTAAVDDTAEPTDDTDQPVDDDGDGFEADEDCDDDDPSIYPGAVEICDGVDRDCNSATTGDAGVLLDGQWAFATIQEGVDAAAAGATLEVCEGTYSESVFVERFLVLQSMGGSSATWIQASGGGAAVTSTAPSLTLRGFTLSGGQGASLDSGYTAGGGLAATGSSTLLVEASVLSGNTADFGGGLFATGFSSVTLNEVLIEENAASYGGGMYLGDASTVASGVEVRGNEAVVSGGGLYLDLASLEGTGLTVSDNAADYLGGGAYLNGSAATVDTSTFERNDSSGGGALTAFDSTLTLDSVDLSGNTADTNAAGLYLFNTDATLEGLSAEENVSEFGAVVLLYESVGAVTGGTYTENEATYTAGVFRVEEGSTLTVTEASVFGNLAGSSGGAASVTDGTLTSVASDWGAGEDDNTPDDLAVGWSGSFSYDGVASFACASDTETCD